MLLLIHLHVFPIYDLLSHYPLCVCACVLVCRSVRDEYVFLKPNHVLPEFLMHVQIVKQPENGSVRKSTDNKNPTLPKNVVMLPQFEADEKKSKEANGLESPSKSLKTKKLNDWMSQLDNALNNPNANSMTVVEKSRVDALSESLVAQTGEPSVSIHFHFLAILFCLFTYHLTTFFFFSL